MKHTLKKKNTDLRGAFENGKIVLTKKNFKDEVLRSEMPVLVDFYAEWCGPCRMMSPIIDSLAEEFKGRIKIGTVNIDDEPNLPMKYGVQSIPTLILFKGGNSTAKLSGFHTADELKSALGLK